MCDVWMERMLVASLSTACALLLGGLASAQTQRPKPRPKPGPSPVFPYERQPERWPPGYTAAPPEDDRPKTLTIDVESLAISKSKGRLVVRYRIPKEDWKTLESHSVDLWFNVDLSGSPEESKLSQTIYTAAVPERRGEVNFPKWLGLDRVRQAGLCPMGTGPGDNLGFGRGYVCADRTWLSLRDDETLTDTTLEMTYRRGFVTYPSYPWFDPLPPNGGGDSIPGERPE